MLEAARDPMWKWPDWCDDHGVANTWYITRTNGCGVLGGTLTIVDTRTGRPVGGIDYLSVGYEFSNREIAYWGYQVALLEVKRWGQGTAGTKVRGSAKCKKKCKVGDGSFPVADDQRRQDALWAVLHRHHDQHPQAWSAGQRLRHHEAQLHQPRLGLVHPRGAGHSGRAL
ncbi:hypothetical protein ABZS96_28515 [Streptomyces avermitilis]|uniref:hypothetical protein n=1 Tax=Streptomyces avermitilis TaxID=33903 RepID=UPI0033BE5E99